jgi:hypothetical protein
MKAKLQQHLLTGFVDWSANDYARFMKSFKKRDLGDIEGIANDIDKSPEQVQTYLQVFLKRFRELKERDMVVMKFEKKTFEQRTLEMIKEYDHNQDYYCLV